MHQCRRTAGLLAGESADFQGIRLENDWENPKVNIKVKLMECSDTKVWEIQVFVLFISEYL